MILAQVIGTVVTENLTDWLESPAFLLVEPIDSNGKPNGDAIVVLDLIGANREEIVLVSQGSSVRQTDSTKDKPLDAVIAGVVDIIERNGDILMNRGVFK